MSIRQIKQKTDIHTTDTKVNTSKIKLNTTNRQILDGGMTDAEIEMLLLENLNSRERIWWNRLSKSKKRKFIDQARTEIKAYHLKNPLSDVKNTVISAKKSSSRNTSSRIASSKIASSRIITGKKGKAIVSGTIASAMQTSANEASAKKEELVKRNVDGRDFKSNKNREEKKKKNISSNQNVSAGRKGTAKAIRGTLAVIGTAGFVKKIRMVRKTKGKISQTVVKNSAKKTKQKEKLITSKGLITTSAASTAGGLDDGVKGAVKEGAGAATGMLLKAIPLPIRLIIVGVILVLAILLFILPVLFGGAFSAIEDTSASRTSLVPISITGTYNGSSGSLDIEGTTISFSDIPITGDSVSFTGYLEGSGVSHEIPNGLGRIHTYMGWQMITSPSSPQYAFKEATGMPFNEEGFGFVNGRYVVACTTTFGDIGDTINVYKENGTIIPCVIGDIKNQNDPGCNMYGHQNGQNIIEFVVDRNTWYRPYHSNPGTASCHPEWNSPIIRIDTGAQDVSLEGTFEEDGSVTISGTIGGIEVYATGTFSGGAINASGYYGNGASAIANGGVEGMVQFAIGIAEDDNLWYSQNCRECYLCYRDGSYGYGGHDYYDCSSLVTAALAHGMGNPDALYACSHGAPTTEDITGLIEQCGFVNMGTPSQCEPQRGDILWYRSGGHGHVAICTGGRSFIHASSSKGEVCTSSIGSSDSNYWYRNFVCGRRFA